MLITVIVGDEMRTLTTTVRKAKGEVEPTELRFRFHEFSYMPSVVYSTSAIHY